MKGEIIMTFDGIKNIVEFSYFIAGIIVCGGILISLKQFKIAKEEIKLLTKDFEVRNQRASIEKSIEYLNLFATDFIPNVTEFSIALRAKNIKYYKGKINKEFSFDENCSLEVKYVKDNLIECHKNGGINILNKFEYFSAALISGLADEDLAFNPLARLYCDYVEMLYIPLCYSRKDDTNGYSYIVKLYSIWKSRLERVDLERKKTKIDEEISKITDVRIQSIGNG
jgi:hypothetical protein